MEGQFELPDGWHLRVTREEDGRYLATLEGEGQGVRTRGNSPGDAVATLASAIHQDDRVGLALRAYIVGGEKLLKRAIADSTPAVPAPATWRDQTAPGSAAAPPFTPDDEPGFEWVPVRAAAYRLGVTPETVRSRIRKGELQATKTPPGPVLGTAPGADASQSWGTLFSPCSTR